MKRAPHPYCVPPPVCPQVAVKRGLSYLRCIDGQIPTMNVPCEAGVVAFDDVDGASIQDRVRDDGGGPFGWMERASMQDRVRVTLSLLPHVQPPIPLHPLYASSVKHALCSGDGTESARAPPSLWIPI